MLRDLSSGRSSGGDGEGMQIEGMCMLTHLRRASISLALANMWEASMSGGARQAARA